jgi:hypothetical protein
VEETAAGALPATSRVRGYWTRSTANQLPLEIPVDVLANVVDDFALGVDTGIGAAYAVGEHWSIVTELGALFASPVSSRGDDSLWDWMPLPPRGFFHVGLGLQYAR